MIAPAPAPLDPARLARLIRKVQDAMAALGYHHPQLLLAWARCAPLFEIDPGTPTMSVDARGKIRAGPDFVERHSPAEIAGVISHELLHLLMQHFDRRGGRDGRVWNIAGDCVINDGLRSSGIALPAGGLATPGDYTGEPTTEALYDYFMANPDDQPEGGDDAGVGEGCGVQPAPEGAESAQEGAGEASALRPGETWGDVAATAEQAARAIGKGSTGISRLLAPTQGRANWKQILGRGVALAQSAHTRDVPTYARASRRQMPGTLRPGWRGTEPKVAVVIDVSGSMNREWINNIIGECKRLRASYPAMKLFVVAHTTKVVWSGWIESDSKWEDATAFSGGTDADPAYALVGEQSVRFDVLVHFTDGELGRWPTCPARKLVVGAFGAAAEGKSQATPPPGAVLIPCAA